MSTSRVGPDRMNGSPGRAFVLVFLIAFAIRAFFLTKVPDRYVYPHTRWEIPAIAMSLYENGEFANPYAVATGPTAHNPPLYPGWISLIYGVFGISLMTGYIRWLFDIAFAATLFASLPWLSVRFGLGFRSGLLGGLAGAIIPRWPAGTEVLAAIALALLLVAFLDRWERRDPSVRRSLLLGIAAGVVFHIKPALLPVVLGCMAFEVWWIRNRRAWTRTAVIAVGIAIAIAPWTWRNWISFHEFYFIRSNLGLELRVGNHENAHPDVDVSDARKPVRHPRGQVEEAILVRDLGEAEYMRQAKAEALQWIRSNPGEYAKLVAGRAFYFWTGPIYRRGAGFVYLPLIVLAAFGAWKCLPDISTPERAVLLIPLVTFPVVYYLVAYMPRYRIPIEWILILLAGAAVSFLIERGSSSLVGEPPGVAP